MVPYCKCTKYWSVWCCNTNSDVVLNHQNQTSNSKSNLTPFHVQYLVRFWSILIKLRRNNIFKLVGWGRNFPNLHTKEPKHQDEKVPYVVYFIWVSPILSGFVVPLQTMMHDVRIDETPKNPTRRHFRSHVLKKTPTKPTKPNSKPNPKTCLR